MSTPMKPEREAEIREWNETEISVGRPEAADYQVRDLLVELDRLRANEQLAAAAALESAVQVSPINRDGASGNGWDNGYRDGCRDMRYAIRSLDPDAQKLLAAHDEDIRKQERERCARIAVVNTGCNQPEYCGEKIAAAIRALPDATEEDNGK